MNTKQAFITMGEYIKQTYYPAEQQRLRYDEQNLFVAANVGYARRRRGEYEETLKRLDHSLNTAKSFLKVKKACNCRFCEEKYYLIKWEGRDPSKWPDTEGSCIFCVTLQVARLALFYKRDNDPWLITKLTNTCLTPYGKQWRKENGIPS